MKVIATINHTIDKDTAEYIVKEFGHKAIIENSQPEEINKIYRYTRPRSVYRNESQRI